MNVSDRDLVQYDRFRPFIVPDRSPFITVPERFRPFHERLRPFYERFRSFHDILLRLWSFFYRLLYSRRTETAMKSLEKLIKRSGTVRNDHETVENAQER